MKVIELIERLQDIDPDSEVRLMTQETWPFENEVRGVCSAKELHQLEVDADEEDGFADCPDGEKEKFPLCPLCLCGEANTFKLRHHN